MTDEAPGTTVARGQSEPITGVASPVCSHCEATGFSTNYGPCEEKARMDRDGLCFSCAFWAIKADHPSKWTIIDGRSYKPGQEGPVAPFRGMGGRPFDIEYFDGRRVRSTNLWSQGVIPPHWLDALPDNARFLNGAGAVKVGDVTCFNASGAAVSEAAPTPAQPTASQNTPSGDHL